MKRKNTLVISAFPGTGKTKFYNDWIQGKHPEYDLILDSDSSIFKWIRIRGIHNEKLINREFPNNYIEHIKSNIGKADIIFVSTHKEVIQLLKQNDIDFILVYPSNTPEIKSEYLKRYRDRGSDDKFIKLLDKLWDSFINDLVNIKDNNKIILKENEYIR